MCPLLFICIIFVLLYCLLIKMIFILTLFLILGKNLNLFLDIQNIINSLIYLPYLDRISPKFILMVNIVIYRIPLISTQER